MNKSLKKAVKIAAGAGVAYLALGEVVYEGVVNIDLNHFIRAGGKFDKPAEREFYEKCTIFHEANDWFDEQAAGDTVLWSDRMKRETYAKVYFNEEPSDKWAICIHGYSKGPKAMAFWAMKYLSMGFNVILPCMIGHGADKSHYTSMGYYDKYLVLDWIDYVLMLNRQAKIVLHGVSMGSATTMLTTGEMLPDNVVAAVADCGYTSCWDEYCYQAGPMLHLPGPPVVASANIISKLRGNFDFKECSPIKAVALSKTPTLFIHGEGDTFVPYSMMEPLYEACAAEDKQMLSVPNAFHAAAAYFEPELYWNTVFEFIGKYFD